MARKRKSAAGSTSRSKHLLACPFCGIAPGGVDTLSKGEKAVGCYCGAMGPVALTAEDARDYWNQRANNGSTGPEAR